MTPLLVLMSMISFAADWVTTCSEGEPAMISFAVVVDQIQFRWDLRLAFPILFTTLLTRFNKTIVILLQISRAASTRSLIRLELPTVFHRMVKPLPLPSLA